MKAIGTAAITNQSLSQFPAHMMRSMIQIHNFDAVATLFVDFGQAAVVNACYRIKPGETVSMKREDFKDITKQVHLIASAGTPAYMIVDNL